MSCFGDFCPIKKKMTKCFKNNKEGCRPKNIQVLKHLIFFFGSLFCIFLRLSSQISLPELFLMAEEKIFVQINKTNKQAKKI